MDLSAAVGDIANHFLKGDFGGFAASWSAPRVYEVHTFILPEGRGQWARDFARAGIEYMTRIDTRMLWTRVHPDARHVKAFTLQAGFRPAGTHTIDLGIGPVTYDLFDWRPPCQQ